MFEWLVFALVWLGVWLIIFAAKPLLRRQMLWVSAFTALFGLSEPVFVPSYWSPPSLFNLAAITHFDVESLVFCFAVGGISSVLYEAILNARHQKMRHEELSERRWLHLFSLLITPVLFVLLFFLTGLNPIYCAAAAMFAGAAAAVACRPDLGKNTLAGGLLFMGLYFVFFFFVILLFPAFLNSWNLPALSGILVFGVIPLEELMFAFTFGMMWSGVYEHIKHYALH
jgi:hypothetical protein